MLAKVALGFLAAAALATICLFHEGAVRVSVDENKPGKNAQHIHLLVPAAIVPVAMRLVPEHKLRAAAGNAAHWLPAIRVASRELRRLADCDLVEVRDARDHVTVVKRAGLLVVDVHSPDETVHVSFPLEMADRVAGQLASFAPAS